MLCPVCLLWPLLWCFVGPSPFPSSARFRVGSAHLDMNRAAGLRSLQEISEQASANRVLRLRGAGLDLHGYNPVSLDKTVEWINATTFDGSEVQSPFAGSWDSDGYSKELLLSMAAELNDGAAIARLVEAGADIDASNDAKQTALHKAAMMGHESIYALGTLISLGADAMLMDTGNMTALDYARESHQLGFGPTEAVRLLEQVMAVRNGQTNQAEEDKVEDEDGEESPFPVVIKNKDGRTIPAPPPTLVVDGGADQGKLRGKEEEEEETTAAAAVLKKKRKKKRYGSAKERWQALKEHRNKKKAALRGTLHDTAAVTS